LFSLRLVLCRSGDPLCNEVYNILEITEVYMCQFIMI
jgi:hypothetical protein